MTAWWILYYVLFLPLLWVVTWKVTWWACEARDKRKSGVK